MVYNCLHDTAPNEIAALLLFTDPLRTKMFRQCTRQNKYGSRAFFFVGPKLWDMPPKDIQSVDNTDDIKRALKIFLARNGESLIYMMKTAHR